MRRDVIVTKGRFDQPEGRRTAEGWFREAEFCTAKQTRPLGFCEGTVAKTPRLALSCINIFQYLSQSISIVHNS
ncbi:MAG: hypothetical protein LBV44_01900, partial [Methylobacillus sp.]|nr:hypothetical protein [Methylobacillus sp.]